MRLLHKALLASIVIAHALVMCASAQDTRPKFEGASIKPTRIRGPVNTPPGGMYVAVGQSLKALLQYAYRVRSYQIIGGPEWASTDLWEIQAKAAEGSVQPRPNPDVSDLDAMEQFLSQPDTISMMLQSLLEDRFQLKFHRESREMPVYELVIAKSGLKMKLSDDQTPPEPRNPGSPPRDAGGQLPRGVLSLGGGGPQRTFQGRAVPFWSVFNTIRNQLDGPLINKVGTDQIKLDGLYDFKLVWKPGQPTATDATDAGVSIFTALQEQLGLKLESARGPVEVLVVDSVSKPTEN